MQKRREKKKKLFAFVQLCIIYSLAENYDAVNNAQDGTTSIVQIVDRVIIPDNCTALCTHNGARSALL